MIQACAIERAWAHRTSLRIPANTSGPMLLMLVACLGVTCAAPSQDTPDKFRHAPPAVAYSPRGYDPYREDAPTLAQVERDLRLLRSAGFRSIATYGSGGVLGSVPSMARDVGFDGFIVMGLWDPSSQEERDNALRQASYVDAYCVGNEGIGVRYTPEDLELPMQQLRRTTGRPVTTSEQIRDYFVGPHREWLLANSDWLFPTAHPYWAGERDAADAARWLVSRYDLLAASGRGPVILKEASFPSRANDPGEQERQLELFIRLHHANIRFFFFEAFDQPWKGEHHDYSVDDAHWGLFTMDGSPKRGARWITKQFSD